MSSPNDSRLIQRLRTASKITAIAAEVLSITEEDYSSVIQDSSPEGVHPNSEFHEIALALKEIRDNALK